MLVRDCMTKSVELIKPDVTIQEAARKMKDGDFGVLPIEDGDRLIGMVTDRDIALRAVAEGLAGSTPVSQIMSKSVLYCYDDQSIEEVAKNMGDNQVRRLPVMNRNKRLVGILSLADVAIPKEAEGREAAAEALGQISEPTGRESQPMLNA